MSAQEINLALRQGCGFMRSAHEAEEAGNKAYEMKMRSAGASFYTAFSLALKAAPEYQGRKIDEKAIARLYESTKPRPWWDQHLAKVRFDGAAVTRETAKRAIQWHLDLDGARARRAAHALRNANQRKTLGKSNSQGARAPRAGGDAGAGGDTRAAAHSARITETNVATAAAGRAAAGADLEMPQAFTVEDLLARVNRISSAVRKVKDAERAAVAETLDTTAREIERYV